mmetsp:Transcript_19929/g.29506  ORF Transcript_19929/g.29506 Transcript_19929/m.29506 type:complete len:220 (-) Transcript_19929:285-944(-)|eukprot:CAMPEP_0194048468 /NCGR_PEP_ID=MMETSP0009_2-20130614/27370_1 /TAXON_ID=210454 /ORGANISM="Grammatophora oceanica, Strain CCMP 410" /LENGTH=219 /DNA_ID=CAMNT_0038694331 /DNA_START=112 /DNA_END=771 /DNA_ORIENTATION=+
MKTVATLTFLVLVCSTTSAFQSSFTGRASTVASRDELRTPLRPPPSFTNANGRQAMSMPPFLKKLGLRRNKDKEDEDSAVATLEKPVDAAAPADDECVLPEEEEELSETQKLMQQVKDAGVAGVISYALWELGFWAVSVPVCIFGYYEVTGHLPDFSNSEDMQKLGAEAFAFVNFARFAVPLRIGLALSTTPWIQENIVDRFMKEPEPEVCEPPTDAEE